MADSDIEAGSLVMVVKPFALTDINKDFALGSDSARLKTKRTQEKQDFERLRYSEYAK